MLQDSSLERINASRIAGMHQSPSLAHNLPVSRCLIERGSRRFPLMCYV